MTLTAAILVFISVFMHAAWNLMSKTTQPSTAFYLIMNFVGGIIWLPFFVMSANSFWGLPPLFYWLFAATCVFEVVYMYGLAHGYKHGDISLIYPLVRTLPVLMLAVITLAAGIGKPFGVITMIGMIVIACGCFIMPFQSFRNISFKNLNGIALIFVCLGAVGTTGYTLCDSEALKLVAPGGDVSAVCTLGYLFLMQTGLTLGEVPLVVFNNPEALKEVGGNKYIETEESGGAILQKDHNKIAQWGIERSNVDMYNEVTGIMRTNAQMIAQYRLVKQASEMYKNAISEIAG